jgi:ABC-type lipopolysaccharide export system ATPase subunit
MSPELIGALIGSSVALIGSVVNAIVLMKTNKRAKESEERRHYRELIIKSAIETWKHTNESAARSGARTHRLEAHFIRMMKFSELFIDQPFDEATIDKKLSEMNRATEMFALHADKTAT